MLLAACVAAACARHTSPSHQLLVDLNALERKMLERKGGRGRGRGGRKCMTSRAKQNRIMVQDTQATRQEANEQLLQPDETTRQSMVDRTQCQEFASLAQFMTAATKKDAAGERAGLIGGEEGKLGEGTFAETRVVRWAGEEYALKVVKKVDSRLQTLRTAVDETLGEDAESAADCPADVGFSAAVEIPWAFGFLQWWSEYQVWHEAAMGQAASVYCAGPTIFGWGWMKKKDGDDALDKDKSLASPMDEGGGEVGLILMEKMSGDDLAGMIEKSSGGDANSVAASLEMEVDGPKGLKAGVTGLFAALHKKGFIHGDPGPQNVFVDVRDGEDGGRTVGLRLIDFGTMRRASSDERTAERTAVEEMVNSM